MKILHGTWLPQYIDDYIQRGSFYLWVERDSSGKEKKDKDEYSFSPEKNELIDFLKNGLGIKLSEHKEQIRDNYFILPAADKGPLNSYELLKYSDREIPEKFYFKEYIIPCYTVKTEELFSLLNDIYFLSLYSGEETRPGADILFWYHYVHSLREIILKDSYIPSLKYREIIEKKSSCYSVYPSWEIISEKYEKNIRNYSSFIPQICLAASEKTQKEIKFFSGEGLLRHFSENFLCELIWNTNFTGQFDKKIRDTFIYDCIYPFSINKTLRSITKKSYLEQYKKWHQWKERLREDQLTSKFTLCFRLIEAAEPHDNWRIDFLLELKEDPSLKISLNDYWTMNKTKKTQLIKKFGRDMEKEILLYLGYGAKIYPEIWKGLETDKPGGFELNLEKAFQFLKEQAWVLEDAGYKVIVPAWWTPEGRRKAILKIKTSGKSTGSPSVTTGLFTTDKIIQYDYELSIGNERVDKKEWNDLVTAKTPLVKFRGEWMELDRDKMERLIEFWEKTSDKKAEMSLTDIMKLTSENEEIEISENDPLMELMSRLWDKSKFSLIPGPEKFQGNLRDYQKRGLSWISYMENLGLNGCLADDMGLGKTIQVIARLIQEREEEKELLPTLLIGPTSVIGNWQKEIERFAPHLRTFIHHGTKRLKTTEEFQKECMKYDIIITSYSLARMDHKLFETMEWKRIVLDEAQNIKNPASAQARAIFRFKGKHRLGLTGTPVENRLMDLWSVFNFLNPGYLETQAKFRKSFEIPVQKNNDTVKSKILKKLVEPFILRRMKTDKNIIKDLPDKVEQKLYCNLSKEQASLYEAVVKDVAEQIEQTEGIQRKGLILSTLMKLKQICNHPAQFLQDNSPFTKDRSIKLSRLVEMTEEVIESGESMLIFSQFREICIELERLFKKLYYNTYLLHGGINRVKRQEMIEEFQSPDTEGSIFILSLKAGGLGITLTRANHVFHFDRWWNPSVENQATDRAFRIGQEKNVFVHKFVTAGTLEERIDEMIEEKKKLSGAIIGTDESWLTELDNEAFKELISLKKSAVWE